MTQEELSNAMVAELGFEPLPGQKALVDALAAFAVGRRPAGVFVLNGYAGTGKTSVMGAYVRALSRFNRQTVILAPTGRAAKVASLMAGKEASTIHRRIYHPVGDGPSTTVALSPNRNRDTIFIVDEASLINDHGQGNSVLDHLTRHVYTGPGCSMVLVGDTAQLPPVGQETSPAMDPERLRKLGLEPTCAVLDVPVRQASESGVLYNATRVRQAITEFLDAQSPPPPSMAVFSSPLFVNAPKNIPLPPRPPEKPTIPEFEFRGFKDIRVISPRELDDEISSSWSRVGPEETLLVTRSNLRANRFNMAIRNMVMCSEGPLEQGDRLVISRNDYFWKGVNGQKGFISNGETAVVRWVGKVEKTYGRFFADVELEFPADGSVVGAKLMLRSLMAEGPSIPNAEMQRFFQHVVDSQNEEGMAKTTAALRDPYFNALQAKYAYAVTCHKAQGGQWKEVYIDMTGIAPEAMDLSYLRWLYTAMTRATGRVTLIQ